MLDPNLIHKLRQYLHGELVSPQDSSYDLDRRVWNGMIDKKPAAIAKCLDTTDVTVCVNFARDHDFLISVRGGGHNYAGKAVCDGGLVIDLSQMKEIEVNPDNRTAD
ncbi:MAG TPA: FAD-binding protein [Nitrososphaerales archaeon]|nr:FAD-binding protein [Nitrososphaerales archaeon]